MSNFRKRKARNIRHHQIESMILTAACHDEILPCSCKNGKHSRKNFLLGKCQRDYSTKFKIMLSKQKKHQFIQKGK